MELTFGGNFCKVDVNFVISEIYYIFYVRIELKYILDISFKIFLKVIFDTSWILEISFFLSRNFLRYRLEIECAHEVTLNLLSEKNLKIFSLVSPFELNFEFHFIVQLLKICLYQKYIIFLILGLELNVTLINLYYICETL